MRAEAFCVCDSSTLILLARAGLLEGLFAYVDFALIPEGVFHEAVGEGLKRGKLDAMILEREVGRRIRVAKADKGITDAFLRDFRLDKGEAEALALCVERKPLFLCTDDGEALKACRAYGIVFATALGLAVKFFRDGVVKRAELALAIEKLVKIGFYSNDILKAAFEECDLEWKP